MIGIFVSICTRKMHKLTSKIHWGAAIAQWIRLSLPTYYPGFESQAHHLRFLQFIKFKLYTCHFKLDCEKNENTQKEAAIDPLKASKIAIQIKLA